MSATRVTPVEVQSLEELSPVVTVAQVMGLYRVRSYDALRNRIAAGRVPAPFTARPMQWRKSDLAAHLGAVQASVFGRRKAS